MKRDWVYGLFCVAILFTTACTVALVIHAGRLETRITRLEKVVAQLKESGVLPENFVLTGAETVVALAVDDLADRLDIDPRAIRVVEIEPINWPNSCLGSHESGRFCLQVITPGFRIVLEAEGRTWVYHTDYIRVVFIHPVLEHPHVV